MSELAQVGAAAEVSSEAAPMPHWYELSIEERAQEFSTLSLSDAAKVFSALDSHARAHLLLALPVETQRIWLRQLPPDDAADAIQATPEDRRSDLISLLDPLTSAEVIGLLAYAEDNAGGLMTTRYARIRPEMSVDEAISYLLRQTRKQIEDVYYLYVLDSQQKLQGVVSFRDLFSATPLTKIRDMMIKDPVRVLDTMDQEAVSKVLADNNFLAVPVVSDDGTMKGIVTVHDIVDVVREEATEDIQKMAGVQALDAPYLDVSPAVMIRKRGIWLTVLFAGELLTASAMEQYQDEISRAVVLALFIPLIISSGGNSGSQASTLVIRALALGELRGRDWWRVMRRELLIGAGLGITLGMLGFLRAVLWPAGESTLHYDLVAYAVGFSLLAVVTYGALIGGLLPIILKKIGLDPATASAPLVATFVDVTGLIIYFTIAHFFLDGSLL